MTRPSLLAGAALLALALPRAGQAPADVLSRVPAAGTAALVDATVVPMDRERILEHQTVVVRGGRVVALGPARTTAVPAGALRVDGRGRYVMPGLVDMHAHFSAGDASLDAPAGRQLALYLANGFTTARGLSAPAAILPAQLQLRDRIARGEILGPTLYVAGPSINGNSARTPADGARMVEEQQRAGYDVLKTHGGLSAATYDSVAATARRLGIPLVGHVTPEYGLSRAYAAGQQVEHLDGWIAAIVQDGTPVPPGQLVLDPAVLARVDARKLDSLVRETVRRGIWNGPTLALFETLASDETPEQLAARPGLRYVSAAEAATRNPAEWLGRADAGTVAVGKRADLLLLDANPLADAGNVRKIAGLFVGGRWLDAAALQRLRDGVLARVQG